VRKSSALPFHPMFPHRRANLSFLPGSILFWQQPWSSRGCLFFSARPVFRRFLLIPSPSLFFCRGPFSGQTAQAGPPFLSAASSLFFLRCTRGSRRSSLRSLRLLAFFPGVEKAGLSGIPGRSFSDQRFSVPSARFSPSERSFFFFQTRTVERNPAVPFQTSPTGFFGFFPSRWVFSSPLLTARAHRFFSIYYILLLTLWWKETSLSAPLPFFHGVRSSRIPS